MTASKAIFSILFLMGKNEVSFMILLYLEHFARDRGQRPSLKFFPYMTFAQADLVWRIHVVIIIHILNNVIHVLCSWLYSRPASVCLSTHSVFITWLAPTILFVLVTIFLFFHGMHGVRNFVSRNQVSSEQHTWLVCSDRLSFPRNV